MKTGLLCGMLVLLCLTVQAHAQVYVAPVTTYYAPVTTYYAPATTCYSPVTYTAYYAPAVAPVMTYYAPAAFPVTTYYAPAAVPVTTYYGWAWVGRGIVGQPTVYVRGQPIRNALRFVSP